MTPKQNNEPGFLTFRKNLRIIGDAETKMKELEEIREKGSIKKQREMEKQIDELSGLSRRAALQTLAGGAGLIAVAGFGIKTGLEIFHKNEKGDNAIAPTQKESSDEAGSIVFPGMTIMEEKKIKFKKPQGLDMDQQEFIPISRELGESISTFVEAQGKRVQNNLIYDADLKAIAKVMGDAHPKIKEEWDRFFQNENPTIIDIFNHINEYLNAGGYYFVRR